jgi:nitrite reductase/ring-hydroxylating ferredoxin subunit
VRRRLIPDHEAPNGSRREAEGVACGFHACSRGARSGYCSADDDLAPLRFTPVRIGDGTLPLKPLVQLRLR